MKRWTRDPLVHFLVLGAAAFAVYEVFGSAAPADEIVVSRARLRQLATTWQAQWNRPPTPEELEALVDSWLREEVLYREALALGLDRDDTIVRRRLAQKMEFLAADASSEEPDDARLVDFLERNRARFREPALVSFEQVYLSRDERGERVEADARALLARLRTSGEDEAAGDRLLLPRRHERTSTERVAQLFGDGFATAVEDLEPGAWQGPVASSYGLHLVRVSRREPPRDPPFAELRERLLAEWKSVHREEQLAAFHRELRSRYRVTREPPVEEALD